MKILRIALLLCLLIFAAFYTKLQRLESTAWADTLQVSIYPINGDASALTAQYIKNLSLKNIQSIDRFFKRQRGNFSELEYVPVSVSLQTEITSQPPEPPTDGDILKIVFWSLHLRLWSYKNAIDSDKSTVNIFVRYHQVTDGNRLAHSLGLQKGLIGVVNGYASGEYQERNNIVIAHELLHTVGASDKYDLKTGQPIYPEGFARPDAMYDQSRAEIMAGTIPLNEHKSVMPESLRQCIISNKTAAEIGWKSSLIDVY